MDPTTLLAMLDQTKLALAQTTGPGNFQFDWSISVGNIATITVFLFMAALYFRGLGDKVSILSERVTTVKKDLKEDIEDVKKKVDNLGEVLIRMATVDERLNSIDQRINRQREDIDNMRKGEGFVLPDPFAGRLSGRK